MKSFPEITAALLSSPAGAWGTRDLNSATYGELTLYADDLPGDLRTVYQITPYRKSRGGDSSRGGVARVIRRRYRGYDARRNMWTIPAGEAESMVPTRKGEKEFAAALQALALAAKGIPCPRSISWAGATPADIIAGNVPAHLVTL